MKIIEQLNNEELTSKEKLNKLTKLVSKVRSKYGNEDQNIPAPKVPTVVGMLPVGMLAVDEKVAVGHQEILRCISQAQAVAENVEGAVFDRAFEFAVATNPVLCNIDEESGSEY